MAVLASDNFNRADAATLGSNWATVKGMVGQCGIFSNGVDQGEVGLGNRSGSYYEPSVVTFPNNQYSKATLVVQAAETSATLVRAITSGSSRNYYAGGNANDAVGGGTSAQHLWKEVAGVFALLGTGGGTTAPGDTIQTEANGTTIRLLVNGAQQVSVTDSSHASGQPGLYTKNDVENEVLWDDWEGGDFAVAGILRQMMMHHGG